MQYPDLLPGQYYHTRCVDVFVENENACKTAWAVYFSKIRVTGAAISRPPGISGTGNDLKITQAGLVPLI